MEVVVSVNDECEGKIYYKIKSEGLNHNEQVS